MIAMYVREYLSTIAHNAVVRESSSQLLSVVSCGAAESARNTTLRLLWVSCGPASRVA